MVAGQLRRPRQRQRRARGNRRGCARCSLQQRRHARDRARHLVADRDRARVERRLVVAGGVAEDRAERADVVPGRVAQHQLDFVPLAVRRNLEIRRLGVDDAHVVLVGLLADAADVGAQHHVAASVRQRHVHAEHDQLGMARHRRLDERLRRIVRRELRAVRIRIHEVRFADHVLAEERLDVGRDLLGGLRVLALRVAEHDAECADRLARNVLERFLDADVVAGRVRSDDHLLACVRLRGADRDRVHARMRRARRVGQMLRPRHLTRAERHHGFGSARRERERRGARENRRGQEDEAAYAHADLRSNAGAPSMTAQSFTHLSRPLRKKFIPSCALDEPRGERLPKGWTTYSAVNCTTLARRRV